MRRVRLSSPHSLELHGVAHITEGSKNLFLKGVNRAFKKTILKMYIDNFITIQGLLNAFKFFFFSHFFNTPQHMTVKVG